MVLREKFSGARSEECHASGNLSICQQRCLGSEQCLYQPLCQHPRSLSGCAPSCVRVLTSPLEPCQPRVMRAPSTVVGCQRRPRLRRQFSSAFAFATLLPFLTAPLLAGSTAGSVGSYTAACWQAALKVPARFSDCSMATMFQIERSDDCYESVMNCHWFRSAASPNTNSLSPFRFEWLISSP